ncbi:MAG: M81 family metallopeptidase [Pseudomonadota bacterium]
MRVFVAGLFHEANAFSDVSAPLEDFAIAPHDPASASSGDWVGYADFLRCVAESGHEAIAGFYAVAQPSGMANAQTYAALRGRLIESCQKAGKIDAVLLFLHGAQGAEGTPDCAGNVAQAVRDCVGDMVPIGVALDLHANVSETLRGAADLIACCKEYPHVDFPQTCDAVWELIRSGAWQDLSLSFVPVPCFPAATTLDGPMAAIVSALKRAERDSQIGLATIAHAFAHADTDFATAAVLVYSSDPGAGDALAQTLAHEFFDASVREAREAAVISLDHIAAQVSARIGQGKKGTLIIADRADNPGAGWAGDGTHLIHALDPLARQQGKAVGLALMYDPALVQTAFERGAGWTGALALGGHSRLAGAAYRGEATVLSLRDDAQQTLFGEGGETGLGRSCLIEIGPFKVVANDRRQQPFSPEVFSEHGLDAQSLDIIVLKSTNHFYGCFAPIAQDILYCDATGAASEDLTQLPYQHLRRPVWPIDPEDVCRASITISAS